MKKSIILALTLVFALLCSYVFVACDGDSAELKFMLVNNSEYSVVGYEGRISGELEIPSSKNGKPVTTIGQGAFSGCDIDTLIIPNTVKEIGKNAFSNCYMLKEISMSSNIEKVGQDAFLGCAQIKFTNDKNCDYIGNAGNPYLILVRANKKDYNYTYVNEGCKIILDNVFNGCGAIARMTLPDSLVTIGDYAFSSCVKLSTLNIGENSKLAYIGKGAFENCTKLAEVSFSRSLKELGYGAFQNCAVLSSVKFATECELKKISDFAFSYCPAITSITIPKNVETIGASSFVLCKGLTQVTIARGTKLSSIGLNAFQYCSSLTTFNYQSTTSAWRNVGKALYYLDKTQVTQITCVDGIVKI